jgi:hypothetical protein
MTWTTTGNAVVVAGALALGLAGEARAEAPRVLEVAELDRVTAGAVGDRLDDLGTRLRDRGAALESRLEARRADLHDLFDRIFGDRKDGGDDDPVQR